MDSLLHFRPRQVLETEDMVATFVEQELGRHDWAANWSAYKVKYPDFLNRIRGFFHRLGEEVNAQEIAKYIDTMVVQRPGRWR